MYAGLGPVERRVQKVMIFCLQLELAHCFEFSDPCTFMYKGTSTAMPIDLQCALISVWATRLRDSTPLLGPLWPSFTDQDQM